MMNGLHQSRQDGHSQEQTGDRPALFPEPYPCDRGTQVWLSAIVDLARRHSDVAGVDHEGRLYRLFKHAQRVWVGRQVGANMAGSIRSIRLRNITRRAGPVIVMAKGVPLYGRVQASNTCADAVSLVDLLDGERSRRTQWAGDPMLETDSAYHCGGKGFAG
jgi:hypothetical protein